MPSRFVRALLVCAALTGLLVHRGETVRALTNSGSITTLGTALTENFDALGTASTAWTDNTTLPGWYSSRTAYTAGTGSSNTGALYSFGIAGVGPLTDRALGSVGSGTTGTVYWGVKLTNNTGSTITSLNVSYAGEEWRMGGVSGTPPSLSQTVDFQYQVANANVITGVGALTTGWLDANALDFSSPVFGGSTAVALDGNAPANRTIVSATLALNVAPGQEVWLRWVDINHPDNDHGLAIDDFSVTANGNASVDNPPSVSGTTPANAATNVAANSTIAVTFTEPVNAAVAAFTLECPAGNGRTFSVSPALPNSTAAATFTLTPSASLPNGTTCKVTVNGASVTDADGAPDHVAGNPAFSFTTVSLIDVAPSVISVVPANGTANVPVASPISVTFSENVTLGSAPVSLVCANTTQTLTVTAGPKTFTLTPSLPLPYGASCTLTVFAGQVSDTDGIDPVNMAQDATASFTTPPVAAGRVIINEIDADTPGDDRAEFIELYDGGVGHTPLDGLVVVLFNGTFTKADGTTDTSGKAAYKAFDLDGFITDANGYFVLGNPGIGNASIVFDPGQFGLLQNGPDAVGLYVGNDGDFTTGTLATTANLVDAIVYGTDDNSASGLLPLLNAGQRIVNENATGDSQNQASQRCANGSGGVRNTSAYYPGAPSPGVTNNCPAPRPSSDVFISQVYGGGGNSGATFQNDFVELYNRGTDTVDLTGWSLQYSPATSSGSPFLVQPIGGHIGGGEYYLISLASNAAVGALFDVEPNILGDLNLSGTAGKVALVDSFDPLQGGCPAYDPHIKDLVGYGSADCSEGGKAAAAPSNSTAALRKSNGAQDTDVNADDFVTAAPHPRRTATIVELGPLVFRTDPVRNGPSAPRDATIDVTFTEPVTVDGQWFDINCTTTGHHLDATTTGGGKDHYVTPNVNFLAGEQCTVTVFKARVHDVDTKDDGPDTDTLPADYAWTFTVAIGTPPPFGPDVHLAMGNPSAAGGDENNFLMEKPEFALSYNRADGRPNWVSWHLSTDWIGTLTRNDTFRPDPQVPADWYRVQSFDFSGSGFDRGHMTPNADRDKESSIPINQATFLMSNMVAQTPDNNQGPWAAFEAYLRTLVEDPVHPQELYIVAGPTGTGGFPVLNGPRVDKIANNHVRVPASTWKVVLVLPKDDVTADLSRVTCSARTIAVNLPNVQGIRTTSWDAYLTSVDQVETMTGYDFFSNVPAPIQRCIESGVNGVGNLPFEKGDQTITFAAPADRVYGDAPFSVSATGGASGNPVTFTASGACTVQDATITIGSAGTCTISAAQAGDENYEPAGTVTHFVTVAKATPVFSALSSPSIEAGTASTLFTGTIAAPGVVPGGSVTITIGATSVSAPIAADGHFSATLPTAALMPAGSPYAIAFTYAGDTNFTSAAGDATLTVGDTTAPAIGTVTATPGTLGAPNHRMVDVTLNYSVFDLVTAQPVCGLVVTSNEPVNATGDGNTAFDWLVIDARHVQLRAERAGSGSGRVYTLTVTCTDAAGNHASQTTSVSVPK
jgi:endonuclease G